MTPEELKKLRELHDNLGTPKDPKNDAIWVLARSVPKLLDEVESLRDAFLAEHQAAVDMFSKMDEERDRVAELEKEIDSIKAEAAENYWTAQQIATERDSLKAEVEALKEHKRILFEENGRLLAEKESGVWDLEHPVRIQKKKLEHERDSLKAEMEIQVREKMKAIGEYGLMMLERDRALARVEMLRESLHDIKLLDPSASRRDEMVMEALAEDDKEAGG